MFRGLGDYVIEVLDVEYRFELEETVLVLGTAMIQVSDLQNQKVIPLEVVQFFLQLQYLLLQMPVFLGVNQSLQ